MTDLEEALAELAAAEARLAAAEAECKKLGVSTSKPKTSKKTKSRVQKVHHPESGLVSGTWGKTGRAPVGTRVRMDDTPVITKHLDAAQRPEPPKYEGRECLLVASIKDGTSLPADGCRCARCTN